MITLFLATVLGWYLVVMGILFLTRQDHVKAAVSEILAHRGTFFLLSLITFIIGLVMVASHNFWFLNWSIIVSILSWLILISGIVRLFFPEKAISMAEYVINHPEKMRITAIIALIIGIFLLLRVYIF